jgi:hypothetical protein
MRRNQTGILSQVFFSSAGFLILFLMVSLACNIPASQSVQTGSGEQVTSTVGIEGGIVVGPGEVELVVPEGAFTHSTEIYIQEVATAPRLPEEADINVAGKPVEVTFSTQAEADAVFELVLPLEREGGVPDDQYTVLRWDGVRWMIAGGFVEGDHIRVWTNRFSIFMAARGAWLNRPVSFVNNGPYNAVVMPWTYQPFDPSMNEDIPPGFSTVSIAPGGPGLWPNPSRFLSLPLGIYTFCIEWDEDQDLDNDGYLDIYHFILEGPSADLPLHVDENDSIEIAFAEEVQFRTDPIEKLEGGCGSSDVASGSTDADPVTVTIDVIPTEKASPISTLTDLTDEELCELTPMKSSGTPGPVNNWEWWSDSSPVENATATCVNYYQLHYTGQFNDFVVFLFATESEAQDRYNIEFNAHNQWFVGESATNSSLELGDEAWQWSWDGVESRVLTRYGRFVLYGRADNIGRDQCDLDGDGQLESCEVYEAVMVRLAETITNIETVLLEN